jgi:hypothetical protein
MLKNPPLSTCSKCNKPMRFMLVKMGGRKFRCIDCDVPDPLHLPEVTKLLTGAFTASGVSPMASVRQTDRIATRHHVGLF